MIAAPSWNSSREFGGIDLGTIQPISAWYTREAVLKRILLPLNAGKIIVISGRYVPPKSG